MNKETLIQLMRKHALTYPQFLQRAQEKAVATQWGMGIGDPYSLEPYRMELLGIKPGRMLKKPSKPAQNRYCYSFDKYKRVIHKIGYDELVGPPRDKVWLHTDDFYEYGDGYAIRYVFGGVYEGGEDAKLDRIVWAEINGSKISKTFQLEDDHEYTEESYFYDDSGNITNICLRWPECPQQGRDFKVLHESDNVKIFEIWQGEEVLTYPK
jgi:hypothetical protein